MNDQHHAFSFRALFDEATREFGSPDKGFFRTTWLMLISPGHTLRKIFNGEEKNVTTPFRYFLLAYTLFALVYFATGAMDVFAADYVSALKKNNPSLHNHAEEEIRKIMGFSFFLQYPLISTLIAATTVWVAALLTWFRFPLSASQKLSAAFYFYGLTTIITLPTVVLVLMHQFNLAALVTTAIYFIYMLWITHTYDRSRIRFGFLRGLAWYIVFVILSFLPMSFFAIKTGLEEGINKAKSEIQAPQ